MNSHLVVVTVMAAGLFSARGFVAQSDTTRPKPMAADANPVFAVATIKASGPAERLAILVQGRRFVTTDTSLSDLLAFAYGVHKRQITGGPDWLDSNKFDVVAEPDGDGRPNSKQLRVMVQKLISDRFQLSFHRDTKELSVYAIVIGKSGPKLTRSDDSAGGPGVGFQGLGAMTVKNATIADFAGFLQRYVVDRPVMDGSGISGKFDFGLNWTPDESELAARADQIPPSTGESGHPDLYTAIQQQLGLKLQSTKLPIEVLVVEKVAKPSAN